jgi:DNA polymerase-1
LKVICDIETNGLHDPDRLWLIVCKDVDTGQVYVFPEPDRDVDAFVEFAKHVSVWIGHNFLGFDYVHVNRLTPVSVNPDNCIDTLVVSRLTNFLRDRHSLSSYGEEYGLKKIDFKDWSCLSQDMIDYCIRDVEINYRLYQDQLPYIHSDIWASALRTEHDIAVVCNDMHDNGFAFDSTAAETLLLSVSEQVSVLHESLITAFPPKIKLVKEIIPRATRFGTINRTDFRWLSKDDTGQRQHISDLSEYTVGHPFSRIEYVPFNPGSPTQIVERLNEAGWKPKDKTKGHFIAFKEYERRPTKENRERLSTFLQSGWSINENNLSTLPPDCPPAAVTLAKYLLLRSRKKLLETLIEATRPDGRIHASFSGIGAWTQRMSHSDPNLANIPTEKPQDKDDIKVINNLIRSFFISGKDRLLIGVDADGIQLRVLAHYMNDPRFIEALVSGDKAKGTDVHSLNVSAIGPACQGRRDAKTFIYAWLLGAGIGRVAEILDCNEDESRDARERFISYYPGLKQLKEYDIPRDARNGYFQGFDGRYVVCYGETESERRHYMLGGYLQNGESVIMKRACLLWRARLKKERIPFWQVNYVHDEWQTETIKDMQLARYIADVQMNSIKQVGEDLGLRCPMAGSILSAHETIAIGNNWRETH